MIRFILCILSVVLFLILSIPCLALTWLIGKFSTHAQDISSMRIVQWALGIVLFLAGTKVTFIGEENIPKDQAVLFVGNHRSIFDVIITYHRARRPVGYVAKIELTKGPIFSTWGKRMRCLFFDRNDLRQGMRMIMTGIDLIKEGISVCIYPEGTRNKNEDEAELLEFHEGSFRIAYKSGCPVIPLAVSNSVNIWEAQFPKVRKTHVVVEYGRPIYPADLTREEQRHLGIRTREEIRQMLIRNRSLI